MKIPLKIPTIISKPEIVSSKQAAPSKVLESHLKKPSVPFSHKPHNSDTDRIVKGSYDFSLKKGVTVEPTIISTRKPCNDKVIRDS